MPETHDRVYRLLFSHPRMVQDLLRGFVREPWVEELDFSTLERQSETQISGSLDRREQDILWRLRCRGSWIYVYLLLEFQSSVAPYMALRLVTYLGLFYEAYLRQSRPAAGELLPPVVPLVLYNGQRAWTASRELADLVAAAPGGLDAYRPRLRYLVLDELRAPAAEAGRDNLVGVLCELERSRTPRAIGRQLERLLELLPEAGRLRRSFAAFLRHSLLPGRFPEAHVPALLELEEIRPMLRETVIEWTKEWQAEGWQKGLDAGRKEGLRQGRRKGEAEMLLRQLETRFGPLPRMYRQRLHSAGAERLLEWGERLMRAETLQEVFGN